MATLRTVTVKSSGGDYTTLAGALTGEVGDLVTLDRQLDIACYSMTDTSHPVFGSFVVDATRYVRILTPSTERHDGKRHSSKQRLHATGVNEAIWMNSIGFTRLEGLQLKNATNKVLDGVPATVRIADCLLYDSAGNGINLGGGNLSNTIVMNCTGTGFNRNSGAPNCYNCAAVNCGGNGFQGVTAKNCYAGGNTSADFSGGTVTTSHAEDGTANTTTPWSTSSGIYATNVTAGSEDLSIGSLSALKDAGADLSGDAQWLEPGGNVDIIGTARPQGSAWDVGPFEFATAGGGYFPVLALSGPPGR